MPRSVSRSRPPSPADDAAREALGACIDAYSDEKAAAWLRLKFPSFGSSRTSAPPLATKNDREFFSDARLLGFVKTLPDSSGANRPLEKVLRRIQSRYRPDHFARLRARLGADEIIATIQKN